MKVSMLPVEKKQQDFIDLFGGYNHNIRIQDNEFYDMENLSPDDYPTLSPRKLRGVPINKPKDTEQINGILYRGVLYSVVSKNGELMLYKGTQGQRLSGTTISDDIERQLVMMGSYIVILPDKQFFNTADNTHGYIERTFTSSVNTTITVLPCDIDGNVYSIDGVYSKVPENIWDGYVWLDISNDPATLKKYTLTNSTWLPIATNYIRITCTGIGMGFKSGDGVEISGFTNDDIKGINGSTVIQKVLDNDNIVVSGLLNSVNSKHIMRVKYTQFGTTNTTLYCESTVVNKMYANRHILIGDEKCYCNGNNDASLSDEYVIDLDDKTKWLQAKHATLTVKNDVVDSNTIRLEQLGSDINKDLLQDHLPVSLGVDGEIGYVYTNNVITDVAITADAILTLSFPVKYLKKGTTIYPVKEDVSKTLYTTQIATKEFISPVCGEGACLVLEEIWTQTEPITVTRTMPVLDYVIESNNRLWGCRYGKDDKGNFVNQIYASALGDFKNWSVFAGTSADSYFATVGTSGEFTGAVNYMGYPVFFKDDCIHTIYGAYPAQYQINTTMARGVQEGCSKSLTVVNEVLYYKSRDGVMAYTGALPSCISNQLGDVQYYNAVASGYKDKLYVSMSTDENNYKLFVYDTNRGVWYKESGINAKQMVTTDNDVAYLDDKFNVKSLFGSGTKDDTPVEWFAETGNLGVGIVNKKYISKLNIKAYVSASARASIYIKYQNENWRHVKDIIGVRSDIQSVRVPIIPYRCDYIKLLIKGKGDVNIYSISKTIEEGSDML